MDSSMVVSSSAVKMRPSQCLKMLEQESPNYGSATETSNNTNFEVPDVIQFTCLLISKNILSTLYFQMPLQSQFFQYNGKVSLSNKQTKQWCTGFIMLLTCSFFCLQYGGDVTRRMKLLNRQAEGKKKMKLVANIKLPRETFIDVLKR